MLDFKYRGWKVIGFMGAMFGNGNYLTKIPVKCVKNRPEGCVRVYALDIKRLSIRGITTNINSFDNTKYQFKEVSLNKVYSIRNVGNISQ